MRRRDGEQRGSGEHAERAADHAEPALPSCSVQFLEEQKSPENSKKAIGVPQRKGDAKSDVADRIDGQSVGDSPHASRKNGPDYQMRSLGDVGADVRGPADQSRDTPSRQEDP